MNQRGTALRQARCQKELYEARDNVTCHFFLSEPRMSDWYVMECACSSSVSFSHLIDDVGTSQAYPQSFDPCGVL